MCVTVTLGPYGVWTRPKVELAQIGQGQIRARFGTGPIWARVPIWARLESGPIWGF